MNEVKLQELKQAIRASSMETKVYIGSDSQRSRTNNNVRYATVVILHIDGNHGGKMFSFIDNEKDYSDVTKPRYRLIQEAYKACEIATAIVDDIGDREFEIHLDLNTDPKHKSYAALKEATGLVLGMTGQKAKVKPESWCASTAADKLTK